MNNRSVLKGLGALAAAGLLFSAVSFDTGAVAQEAMKKASPKTSVCQGLAESACKGKAECSWVAPKTGKQKPYCRLKPGKKK